MTPNIVNAPNLLVNAGAGTGGAPVDPVPQITAGPVWTNNQDGTVTVTWTTDIATDSEVNYGTTSSYGSTEDDAAVVTSHSITITGLADDVYHFSVGDIDATYASADALGAVTSALIGHFFIYPHAINATTTCMFNFPIANQDGGQTGIVYQSKRVTPTLGGFVTALYSAWQGSMYPGVMFNYNPDFTSGTVNNETSSTFRFRNLLVSGARIGWTVPSWITANNGFPSGQLDHVLVACSAAIFGHFDLIRSRDAVETTIASDQTPAGSGYYFKDVTLSAGNELEPGDILYIRTTGSGVGGEGCRVGCVQAYASTGTFTNNIAHRIPSATLQEDLTQVPSSNLTIWTYGSSTENAWQIAPAGEAERFVGGAAHQGPVGTFGQEYPNVEVWTKDGVTWTPSQDYYRAKLSMVRTSSVYYDASNTNIAEMVTAYTVNANDLQVDSSLTYNESLDTGWLYNGMYPAARYNTMKMTLDGVTNATPATIDRGTGGTWSPVTGTCVVWAYGGSVVEGVAVFNEATGTSTTQQRDQDSGNFKYYNALAPATESGAAADTVKSGRAKYFYIPDAGPVAPTLSATSCTVGSDGRTILIVPVTTTGGITGNTGLTFNVGGSPILLDSTTNNGDGTITCVVSVADTIASADVVTVDVATASLYDAYGIMMAAASGIAVVNESAQ